MGVKPHGNVGFAYLYHTLLWCNLYYSILIPASEIHKHTFEDYIKILNGLLYEIKGLQPMNLEELIVAYKRAR
jgi:hypothetical protein